MGSLLLQLLSGSCWIMVVGYAPIRLEMCEPIGGTHVKTRRTPLCDLEEDYTPALDSDEANDNDKTADNLYSLWESLVGHVDIGVS
uniref:Secreted protein n=1 Tax=Tanacetum cinerariifolium TaxID=118510 RepID=A0A6L2MBW5_TANCI|nr:hypothetical protein [Tanacetum cinerariifolium]